MSWHRKCHVNGRKENSITPTLGAPLTAYMLPIKIASAFHQGHWTAAFKAEAASAGSIIGKRRSVHVYPKLSGEEVCLFSRDLKGAAIVCFLSPSCAPCKNR